MHEIQTPTPGRVVLYAPDRSENYEEGYDEPALQVLPAIVLLHDGAGRVRLHVLGIAGVIYARWGEVPGSPGEPPVGCWCYPAMSRSTVSVENAAPSAADG